jgi:hypothetical protein
MCGNHLAFSFCRFITVVMFVFMSISALAEQSEAPDPLFLDDATLEVTMEAPLTTLVRKRPKNDYLPGVFRFTKSDGSTADLDLEIRTRGHSRHDTCDYPPLSLNFKKSQTKGTLFDNQNKLKLVIHCKFFDRFEQMVLREYLAYRILNAVTEESFRVRLLRVTYNNTEKSKKGQVRYAFLIEHKNRLAERYDLKDLELERTSVSSIQADQLNLTSVFQFLIGNTDFSPIAGATDNECCHNYVLFGKENSPVLAIPYDFDQSGFVDAPYAIPNPNFHIRTVRQRLYRGRCVNNGRVAASLQKFRDAREVIYALVNEQEGLESRTRNRLVDYIDNFYGLIDDPEAVEKKIISRCI